MMRLSLTLLCLAIPGLPQPLTIGVEGGVRLTRDPQIYAPIYDRSNSKPYLVGPMIGGFDATLEPPLTKSARPVGDTEKVAQEWLRGVPGFERRAILPYQRATVSPQYWPFPASPGHRAANQKDREFVASSFGSSGRIRTYNPSVNSRTVCSRLPL